MQNNLEEVLKQWKDDICEEVRALLDRMDKFPEEFIEDRLNNKWYKVRQALDSGEDESPFTVGEYRALHNKLAELKRNELRQSILKTIVHAADDYELTYDDKNRKAAINALRLPTTASTLSQGKVTLNSTELAMIKKLAKEKNNQ
jgi:hypothetical protein